MSSSNCFRCGVVTATLLPSGLCATCHGRDDETRNAADPVAPTHTFAPPSATDSTHFGADTGDPFGLLPESGYRYAEELGRGGMGCVYKAVQVSTEQTVAVKKLRPEAAGPGALARFVREARILAGLNHPNIVRLFDFVPDPHDPHLVMEFVDGEPLSRHLADGKVLPPDRAARLIADAARGVHAAHEAGVIHRDLKPGNLLVTRDDRVKVSDFGLGKRIDADDGLTVTGQVVGGTPGFMAPEQVDETAPECDHRADVWGLGSCLYAAVAGKPPYPTGTKNATRVLSDPLVPPRAVKPNVPPVLDAIICKCLERDPARRYQTAAAVADDLGRYLRNESTVAKPLPWRARVWNKVRAMPRGIVAAWALAAVAGAFALAVILAPKRETPTPPKPDELALLQDQFARDGAVTLVPEKGLPKWSEWVVGRTDIGQLPNGDGAAYIQPIGTGAVILFPKPGESYRVEAELRHMKVKDLDDVARSKVGLILARQRTTGDNQVVYESFVCVEFRDCDPDQLAGNPPTPQRVGVTARSYVYPRPDAGPSLVESGVGRPAGTFVAPAIPPGRWRKVIAEVSHERLQVWFDEDAEAARVNARPTLVLDTPAADIERRLTEHRDHLLRILRDPTASDVRPAHLPAEWAADGGIGVWATDAGLAFRNVTVRKLPSGNK